MPVTDLTLYRNKAYLELCLDLVEEAYENSLKGHYDLVASQLQNILETFEVQRIDTQKDKITLIDFPK